MLVAFVCGVNNAQGRAETLTPEPAAGRTARDAGVLPTGSVAGGRRRPMGSGPDAGDGLGAGGAAALRGDMVLQDAVSVAGHQQGATPPAAGVLVLADAPRQVAGVDVSQAGLAPDLRRPQEGSDGRVVGVCHLVVLVEGRHVPGDVGRDRRDEAGRLPQLLVRV